MKKISLILAAIFMSMMVLTACGSKSAVSNSGSGPMPSEAPSAPDVGFDYQQGESAKPGDDIYSGSENKIIRTARLTIQTTEFEKAVAALNNLVEQYGGYYESADVSSGSYYNEYARHYGNYVIRIPKENFNAFRDSTGSVGHVSNLSENNQDVGESYYDTEARLETLQVKRDRLLALLEKAEVMSDIIMLENELADVQYQIDMHTATLRRYDSLIGYSTFHLELEEVSTITADPGVTEPFGSRLLSSLSNGFREFGESLQLFILWVARNLIGIIIFAVVVTGVTLLCCRLGRKKKAKKNQP